MSDERQMDLITPAILERGVIRNRDMARQVRDFSGLRYGNITPSDMDGIIDFGNKAFVLIEVKYETAPLMKGQELLLERTVQRIVSGGALAIALVASHKTPSDDDIDVARATVRRFYTDSAWQQPSEPVTVRQFIDDFLIGNGLGYYL